MNKTKLRLLMLVAIWAGSSWLSPAQAQSAQYTCTPAGSTSGANCISPEIGPWRYHIYQLGYNWDNAYSNTTWFETAGQMFAWIQARVEVKSSNSWCNVEHTATDWNYTGLPPAL